MKNELARRNRDYDFFEEAMQDFFPSFYGRNSGRKYMRTDIKESDDAYTMEVELPGAFLAWPGDLVTLAPRYPVGRGIWRVAEMTCALDQGGLHTRLILGEPDALQ